MVLLQDKQRIENNTRNFQVIEKAKVVAIKLQINDNWAEILNHLNNCPAVFRLLVMHFWEFDVFGETDFSLDSADISELSHLEIVYWL